MPYRVLAVVPPVDGATNEVIIRYSLSDLEDEMPGFAGSLRKGGRSLPLLPGPLDHDGRRDLNALGGSPDRPIDQRIRSLEAHLFGVGAGDESFKFADGTWRKVTYTQLGEFNHLCRSGQTWIPHIRPSAWASRVGINTRVR